MQKIKKEIQKHERSTKCTAALVSAVGINIKILKRPAPFYIFASDRHHITNQQVAVNDFTFIREEQGRKSMTGREKSSLYIVKSASFIGYYTRTCYIILHFLKYK